MKMELYNRIKSLSSSNCAR